MKSQSKASLVPSFRCSHRTAIGRQCRQLCADAQSRLCPHHRDKQKQSESIDLSRALLARSQNFQTAQGLNFALANIYRLLAANRISPRRASVLAYINSLLLRTLPAIDADQEAGITDPTAPEPQQASAPDVVVTLEAADDEPENETESANDAKPDSPDASSREALNAKHSAASPSGASTTNNPTPPSKYRSYWDTISDPTKKPS